MRQRILSFLGGAALLLGGGAYAAPAAGPAPALELGSNLAGEACRSEGAANPARAVDILCGPSTAVAGRVQVSLLAANLPGDVAARRG